MKVIVSLIIALNNLSYFLVQWLKVFLPCFWTLEGYRLRDLPIDWPSGFTVGAMVIPQGMSCLVVPDTRTFSLSVPPTLPLFFETCSP